MQILSGLAISTSPQFSGSGSAWQLPNSNLKPGLHSVQYSAPEAIGVVELGAQSATGTTQSPLAVASWPIASQESDKHSSILSLGE